MATFEDFEDEAVDSEYVETVGDGWSVQALNRTSGFAPPTIRALPDPIYTIPPASGLGSTQGLAFIGSSAFALSVDCDPCRGLGGFFFSDSAGAGASLGASSSIVQIGFSNVAAAGSITVDRRAEELWINEFYDDLVTFVDNDTVIPLTDFLSTTGEELAPSGVWLEISFRRSGGWFVRDATTGNTLASGDYPWTIPTDAPWSLSHQPNSSGPGGLSGSDRVMADNIYGFPGFAAPVVRLFPRDDGRGMSSAPRIHPMPKGLSRVIGGYQ